MAAKQTGIIPPCPMLSDKSGKLSEEQIGAIVDQFIADRSKSEQAQRFCVSCIMFFQNILNMSI